MHCRYQSCIRALISAVLGHCWYSTFAWSPCCDLHTACPPWTTSASLIQAPGDPPVWRLVPSCRPPTSRARVAELAGGGTVHRSCLRSQSFAGKRRPSELHRMLASRTLAVAAAAAGEPLDGNHAHRRLLRTWETTQVSWNIKYILETY